MTINEAIQALKYDRALFTFDLITGEDIDPDSLSNDNRKAYEALGMAIELLEEKKTRVRCDTCKHWSRRMYENDRAYGQCKKAEEMGAHRETFAEWYCANWEKRTRNKKK